MASLTARGQTSEGLQNGLNTGSAPRKLDLRELSLSAVIRCGSLIREMAQDARSMEDVAEKIVRYFYDNCRDPAGNRDIVLARFFKTHSFGNLETELQAAAQNVFPGAALADETKCLVLLGTAGELPTWNSRHDSGGHKAIPLVSEQSVAQIPMIARLIRQFGLQLGNVVSTPQELMIELDERTYNVFHVERALGSEFIPAQKEFVIPHQVASVIGFGGMLPTGNLYSVILFTRANVPRESAEAFRTVALSVKTTVLPFEGAQIFRRVGAQNSVASPEPAHELSFYRSKSAALEEIGKAYDSIVIQQSEHLERTVADLARNTKALQSSEAQIRTIMEHAGDGIITINEQGMIESYNAAAEKTFGHRAEEAIGKNVALLMPEPYRREHDSYLQRYLTTGQRRIIGESREVQGRHKDGSALMLELHVSEVRVGNRILFTGLLRDIAARKKNEERVTALGRILDDTNNEIYIFKADSLHFVQANRAARANLGYTLEELQELTPLDLETDFTPATFDELLAPLRTVAMDSIRFTTTHCRKDGTTYPVEVHLQRSTFESWPVFVALILDISERLAAKEELEKAQAELMQSEKLATVGQLAAGIAHEINTPIQFIGDNVHACSQMFETLVGLLTEYRGFDRLLDHDDRFKEKLKKIRDAEEQTDIEFILADAPVAFTQTLQGVERVSKIVQAMKNFSHAGHGVQKELFDLNAALDDTLTIANNQLKHVAEVTTDFGEIPQIEGSAGELNQVFLNLLINASHAIQDRNANTFGAIRIQTRRLGDEVVVTISDTGCGIPESIRQKIYDPFFTTKEVGRGSGQGLAIARSIIVDGHGGQIDCESKVGEGATFYVRLPLRK
jgi:PAS domain S-box-containing protein